jgi:hypothetical protein
VQALRDMSIAERAFVAFWTLVGLAAVAMILFGCGARYTDEDMKGDRAAEQMLSRVYALDAGASARAYSRAGLCAVQQNLFRHDAGRLVGEVSCVQKREP